MSSECNPLKPLMIVGYTTRTHLVLDLDNTSFYKVEGLAVMIIHNYPEVGNCQIMQSSAQKKEYGIMIDHHGIPHHHVCKCNYHLIFGNEIGYKRCMEIINMLVNLNVLNPQYRRVRMFRGDMTVRISPTILSDTIKPAPHTVGMVINHIDHRGSKMITVYNYMRHAVNGSELSVFPAILA